MALKHKTREEIALELKREQRRQARATRRAARGAEAALQKGVDAGIVDPKALGVKQQTIAASKTPKKMADARQSLADAFELMGGVPGLVRWGKRNPTEFYRIWARLIPKEAADATGALPLESLLDKLAARSEQSVLEAAEAIGEEALAAAHDKVSIEDAEAAYRHAEGSGTLQ